MALCSASQQVQNGFWWSFSKWAQGPTTRSDSGGDLNHDPDPRYKPLSECGSRRWEFLGDIFGGMHGARSVNHLLACLCSPGGSSVLSGGLRSLVASSCNRCNRIFVTILIYRDYNNYYNLVLFHMTWSWISTWRHDISRRIRYIITLRLPACRVITDVGGRMHCQLSSLQAHL